MKENGGTGMAKCSGNHTSHGTALCKKQGQVWRSVVAITPAMELHFVRNNMMLKKNGVKRWHAKLIQGQTTTLKNNMDDKDKTKLAVEITPAMELHFVRMEQYYTLKRESEEAAFLTDNRFKEHNI
jgi:hypothetical protein